MRLIWRYLFKSTRRKWALSLFMLLSLTVACALFATAISMRGAVFDWFEESARQTVGTSDIVMRINENKSTRFASVGDMELIREEFDDVVTAFSTNAVIIAQGGSSEVLLTATELDQITRVNYILPTIDGKLRNNEIIIGQTLAGKLGLSAGDTVEVSYFGSKYPLNVRAVASDSGVFNRIAIDREPVIVNHSTMRTIFPSVFIIGYTPSLFNVAFFRTNNVDSAMQSLRQIYPDFVVARSVDVELIYSRTDFAVKPVQVGLFVALILATVIVCFVFRVYYRAKSEELVSLRTIGLSRGRLFIMLAIECALAGLAAATLAYFVYTLVMRIMYVSFGFVPSIALSKLIATQIFGVAFGILVGAVPQALLINATTRRSVKSIPLKRYAQIGIGAAALILIIVYLAVPAPIKAAVVLCGLLFGLAILAPFCVGVASKLLCRVLSGRAKFFATNLKSNSRLYKTAAICLALGLVMTNILNLGVALMRSHLTAINAAEGEITVSDIYSPTDALVEQIRAIDGVVGAHPLLTFTSASVNGSSIGELLAITADGASYMFPDQGAVRSAMLSRDDGIVLSPYYRDVVGLNVGDTVSVVIDYSEHAFVVSGFVQTSRSWGKFAITNLAYTAAATSSKQYSRIVVSGSITRDELRAALRSNNYSLRLTADIDAYITSTVESFFTLVKGYRAFMVALSVLAVFLALLLFEIYCEPAYFSQRLFGLTRGGRLLIIALRSMLLAVLTVALASAASVVLHPFLYDVLLLIGEYQPYLPIQSAGATAIIGVVTTALLALPLYLLTHKERKTPR